MSSSIPSRLLKFGTAHSLALAALAAGCERRAATPNARELSVAAPAVAASAVAASAPAVVPPQLKAQEVAIDNFSFNPPALSVAAGTTITWVNHDDIPHTVTANDKGFTSGALDTDDRFSHVFTTPGRYVYFCAIHPHMTGQIIVK